MDPPFEEYSISSNGTICRGFDGPQVPMSKSSDFGDMKVNLYDGTEYRTKSVKVLVAKYFVVGESELMNTPILLDNVKENLCWENILWRPRWFAWKYTHQFRHPTYWNNTGPLASDNGFVYETAELAAKTHGILIEDIIRSIHYGWPVFPTDQIFRYSGV